MAFVVVKLSLLVNQTPKKPRFVVVYGGPRTGTSLTMDIVKAAQYNAGICHVESTNLRRGRNEHLIFSQPLVEFKIEDVWRRVEKEKVTCAKIIGFPKWIDLLSTRFSVSIVAPDRDKASRNKSAANMLLHRTDSKDKINLQESLLAKRQTYLDSFKGRIARVSFDCLITKDPKTFEYLREFLGYKGPIEDLMAPVDAERVKFK